MAEQEAPIDFEKSLEQLEKLVEQMEQGDLTLEQSLAAFEQGVKLTKTCQNALKEAEQRVQILVEQNGNDALVDFDTDTDAE